MKTVLKMKTVLNRLKVKEKAEENKGQGKHWTDLLSIKEEGIFPLLKSCGPVESVPNRTV